MRLTMKEKKALVKATASRYRRSTKKAKNKILDEFVESTGYNRSYASLILRHRRVTGEAGCIWTNRREETCMRCPH